MEIKSNLKEKPVEFHLFWPSKDEFVTPFSFEECIRRINALDQVHWETNSSSPNSNTSPAEFELDLQQDNGGVFIFNMSGQQKTVTLKAEAIGQLIYTSDHQTRIKLQVGFTVASIVALIVVPVIIYLLRLITASTTWDVMFVIFGFILVRDIIVGFTIKDKLRYDIQNALTIPLSSTKTSTN